MSVSEMPSEVILEGLCKSKLQDSVQLQDCVGFVRSRKLSSHAFPRGAKLFRALNERVESGVASKSQKGRKASAVRKVKSNWTMFHRRLMQFPP